MSDALKAREALRNHCQQLLDIIDNYDIAHEAVDEDIEVVEATRAALSTLDQPSGVRVGEAFDAARKAKEYLTRAADEMREKGVNGWPVACDYGAEAITNLLSALDQPSGVRVKKLEWREAALVASALDGWLTIRIAETPFGQYRIDKSDRHRLRVSLAGQALANCHPTDEQAALAAAQTDYERRTLSALDLSAIGAEGWRTMDSAPKDGSPLMVWVVDGFMQPHCFAPISITEDGAWWDDSTGDQIEPITGATAWQRAPSPPEPRS